MSEPNSAPPMESTVSAEASKARNQSQREGSSPDRGRGRGRGGRGNRGGKRNRFGKKPDMGRSEWSRNPVGKRARNDATQEAKRRKLLEDKDDKPVYAVDFSKEEIENEERRPKKKVAVMIGYSGSGYKGMQLNHKEKTIEGDLFKAFVAAGAVSKANADDPKKSSLVRCARTDKGVHAAGNVISMKLIIEDEDITKKINENLSPQIRVWGMVRTNNTFSSYQQCDSRIYEYLIPTHCFLPPHPSSFLWKKLTELNNEAEDSAGFEERQKEVSLFWSEAEEKYIKPILDRLDPKVKPLVLRALYDTGSEEQIEEVKAEQSDVSEPIPSQDDALKSTPPLPQECVTVTEFDPINVTEGMEGLKTDSAITDKPVVTGAEIYGASMAINEPLLEDPRNEPPTVQEPTAKDPVIDEPTVEQTQERSLLDSATKELKAAYLNAKKSYRIDSTRLERVRSCLSQYVGIHNFHNYTIQKLFVDPSAKRIMKSFVVNGEPLIINNTEWLSLKVHGQSFMMHQIRKMVSMVALVVRCGCPEERIKDSYMSGNIMIPKAPGLGLLLERPVFDTYNYRKDKEKDPIKFTQYEAEMEEFKKREIYERMFREEEKENQFHTLFATHDNMKSSQLFYLSALGTKAVKKAVPGDHAAKGGATVELDPESENDENPEDG
ncbi:MAG: tRNA pseudouridine synthase 1 [Icmadophila ericetorum]|nr:tRNA pseudouridine synthase 1 [Icmadophila ericetorum]